MSEQPNNPMNSQDESPTITEKVEVAGNQLVERVKELIEQGNVRRIIIRNQEGAYPDGDSADARRCCGQRAACPPTAVGWTSRDRCAAGARLDRDRP